MVAPFDKSQLPKCYDRLNKAKESLFYCRSADSFDAFVSSWADFLMYCGAVIHAVEGGAQGTPQGRQWYGGIRKRDRSDELLMYMLQARNEEEHGRNKVMGENVMPGIGVVNPITQMLEPMGGVDYTSGELQEDGTFKYRRNLDDWERTKRWKIGIGHVPTGPVLVPVRDSKFLKVFPPPSNHKGKPLRANTPVALAEVYVSYLKDLIDEAAAIS